jgi:hypothetical protein
MFLLSFVSDRSQPCCLFERLYILQVTGQRALNRALNWKHIVIRQRRCQRIVNRMIPATRFMRGQRRCQRIVNRMIPATRFMRGQRTLKFGGAHSAKPNALSLVVFVLLQVAEWSESWQNAMRELLKGKPQTADVVSISCAKHKSGRNPHSGISFPACSNHSTADMVSTIFAKEAQGRRNNKKESVWPISTQWHFVSSMLKPLNCGHGEYYLCQSTWSANRLPHKVVFRIRQKE